MIAAYGPRGTNAPCAFGEFTGARFTLMYQVELRYISLGGRTRSGRLVDVHHLAFLSGDDHCSIQNGASSQRCDPRRSLFRVLVYEGGVICGLYLYIKLRRSRDCLSVRGFVCPVWVCVIALFHLLFWGSVTLST